MLELIPTGGLCNKMRAIDAAVSFCAAYDIPLKVYWIRDEELINCQFRNLFQPVKKLNLYELDELPLKVRKGKITNLFLPNILRKVFHKGKMLNRWEVKKINNAGGDFKQLYDQHQRLILFSFSRFFATAEPFKIFKPVPLVQEMIAKETQYFNDSTIGIHIRRTDHELSIAKSHLAAFEQKIETEIAKDSRANFYLASDCSATKKHLVDKYGKAIRTNFAPGDRTTLQGMYQGVTELYTLAKTHKIYGSYGSSYSGTAAILAGIERIQVQ